jgi:impB/mucB/samB family C-terminal domain
VSRSATLPSFTSTARDVADACLALFCNLNVPADQVRGVGIVVSRLDRAPTSAAASARVPSPAKGAAGALPLALPRSTTSRVVLPCFFLELERQRCSDALAGLGS